MLPSLRRSKPEKNSHTQTTTTTYPQQVHISHARYIGTTVPDRLPVTEFYLDRPPPTNTHTSPMEFYVGRHPPTATTTSYNVVSNDLSSPMHYPQRLQHPPELYPPPSLPTPTPIPAMTIRVNSNTMPTPITPTVTQTCEDYTNQ